MSAAPASHTHAPADAFADAVLDARPLLVLSGAGISAASGIPTYRDTRGTWLRSAPITHREFLNDPRQRQRYWGRATLGWPAVRDASPSLAHELCAELEHRGLFSGLVTQNVDRLHQRAGSCKVIDLHGRLDRVRCLDCGSSLERDGLQIRLLDANPFLDRQALSARPDGDADLDEGEIDRVVVPDCPACGGTLMPDVIFFGGSIPGERVAACRRALEDAHGLLVVGSSLQVYSGYRFCRWAAERGLPIFLLNPGQSRADALASSRLVTTADRGLAAIAARAVSGASTAHRTVSSGEHRP